jgi:hypothetical protein
MYNNYSKAPVLSFKNYTQYSIPNCCNPCTGTSGPSRRTLLQTETLQAGSTQGLTIAYPDGTTPIYPTPIYPVKPGPVCKKLCYCRSGYRCIMKSPCTPTCIKDYYIYPPSMVQLKQQPTQVTSITMITFHDMQKVAGCMA